MTSHTTSLAEHAEHVADNALRTTHRVAQGAEDLARRSLEAVRDGTGQLRDQAVRASDDTVAYIRHEPVKSVLIAAAIGAALLALGSAMFRSHHGRA